MVGLPSQCLWPLAWHITAWVCSCWESPSACSRLCLADQNLIAGGKLFTKCLRQPMPLHDQTRLQHQWQQSQLASYSWTTWCAMVILTVIRRCSLIWVSGATCFPVLLGQSWDCDGCHSLRPLPASGEWCQITVATANLCRPLFLQSTAAVKLKCSDDACLINDSM